MLKELPVRRERGACCALPARVDRARVAERAALLKAVADPTRLAMLAALLAAKAPVCICDFTAAFELTQPTISHHMSRLREAGLVDSEKRGIWVYYRLRDDLDPSLRRLLHSLV